MLPSRGAVRSLSAYKASLARQSYSNTSRFLDGQGRRFGTSTRLAGATLHGQAGLRPGALRSAAGATLLAGSIPAKRAISFNFWSRPKPETAVATETAAGSAKPEFVPEAAVPVESAAPVAPTPPVDAAASTTSASSFDAINAGSFDSFGSSSSSLDLLSQHANISDIPEQIGYLKTLGLDFGLGPSSMMQWLLEHVYIYTGLPWWAAIAATTVLVRIILLKPSIKALKTSEKMQELQKQPEYQALRQQMNTSLSAGDQNSMQEARMAISAIHKRNNVSPFGSLWGFLQIPVGYGSFVVLNNMAKIPVPSLETGGVAWFTDLSIADPFYVLPVLAPIGMVWMLSSQMKSATEQTKAQMKLMGYILVPLSLVFTIWLPAGVQFYFLMSTLIAVGQNALLRVPFIRTMVGLEPNPPSGAPISAGLIDPLGNPIDLPAPEANSAASRQEEPKKSFNPMSDIKQAIHNAKGGMGDFTEAKMKEKSDADLKAWEARRAEEDRQKILTELNKKRFNKKK